MFSKINNISIFRDEPLCRHSSFQVGGKAKYFVLAHNIDSLIETIFACSHHHLKYKIIGGGSNMLFDDKGYNGAIIKYTDNFKKVADNKLYASAGNSMSELIQYTTQYKLSGLEFSVGVPADLGGAVFNNLGAYNQDIGSLVECVTTLKNKQIIYLTKNDCVFNYHSSSFHNNHHIILSAVLNLQPSTTLEIAQTLKNNISKRSASQPLEFANAGSVFKRENNIIPAKLIDEAGLKGLRVGGAEISTKHAGFIVNKGCASCHNIIQLIELVKQKVYEKFNIILNTEIEYLPF